MNDNAWTIVVLWLVFAVFWAVSALRTKRTVSGVSWSWEIGARVAMLAAILFVLAVPGITQTFRTVQADVSGNALMGGLGVFLCAFGVGLAIYARIHLGRNWGTPMSRKENPDLVTTGPYTLIRHPIYAGLLVIMLGSALGMNVVWVVPLVLSVPYLLFSARREEKIMMGLFPEKYPAYMKRTKMLVPYVL